MCVLFVYLVYPSLSMTLSLHSFSSLSLFLSPSPRASNHTHKQHCGTTHINSTVEHVRSVCGRRLCHTLTPSTRAMTVATAQSMDSPIQTDQRPTGGGQTSEGTGRVWCSSRDAFSQGGPGSRVSRCRGSAGQRVHILSSHSQKQNYTRI